MTQANEKVEDNIPLEYQIFALSLRKNGAINNFKENNMHVMLNGIEV
jgi:hypothetical protein